MPKITTSNYTKNLHLDFLSAVVELFTRMQEMMRRVRIEDPNQMPKKKSVKYEDCAMSSNWDEGLYSKWNLLRAQKQTDYAEQSQKTYYIGGSYSNILKVDIRQTDDYSMAN